MVPAGLFYFRGRNKFLTPIVNLLQNLYDFTLGNSRGG
ncbi:hypothetical protein J3E64_001494 [Sphingobium sp. OAS761]|nr:hypothetical protein [Sphingobium sp. OAS761]